MTHTFQSFHNAPAGQMGAWAPYYDLIMKVITLGREATLREATLDAARVKAADNVLEVGCGTGTLTLAAKKRVGPAGEVHGLDAAPEMVAVAQRKSARAGQPITFRVGSIAALPYADDTFDVALCSFMIFHLPDDTRQTGLKEIRRVLKPGGRVLIVDALARPEREALRQGLAAAGFREISAVDRRLSPLTPTLVFMQGAA